MMKTNISGLLLSIVSIALVSCNVEKKEYYKENGALLSKYQVKWYNHELRDGHSMTFAPDSTLLFEGQYRNGLLDGKCSIYYENGNLESTVIYESGKLLAIHEYLAIDGTALDYGQLVNGNGRIRKYSKSGKLWLEGDVVDGLREGEWIIYSNHPDIHLTAFYIKGVDQETGIKHSTW